MSFIKSYHQAAYPAIDPTRPELSAAGKTVIITGASGGLGADTVRTFAAAGASHIIITGRTIAGLTATKEAIQKLYPGASIHPVASGLQDEADVESVFADIAKSVGPFHVLVHNAGYLPDLDPVLGSSAQDYWKGFEVNVKGAFNVARAFLRHAVPKGAAIVNISSAAVHFGVLPGYSSYVNSKIAALSLFNFISGENPDVRVVNVQPGLLDTDMGKKSSKVVPVEQFDELNLPASFAVYAASPEAAFLDGRFVWANWDVTKLKEREEDILKNNLLTMQLKGCEGATPL